MDDVDPRPCSIASSLTFLGEKWSFLVVRELALGVHRFDAIRRNTGAPRDVLTARLRRLEEVGVLQRRLYQERPERFEYVLTEAGRELRPILLSLAQWGDRWAPSPHSCSHTVTRGEGAQALRLGRAGYCGGPLASTIVVLVWLPSVSV